MSFLYPKDLLPVLRERWYVKRESETGVPDLPPDDIILEMLEVAYHASMRTEESRRVGLRLAYVEPNDQQTGCTIRSPHHTLVRLSPAREFSVSEVVRLAPATDLTQVIMCVSRHIEDEGRLQAGLTISGLIMTGSAWWAGVQGEPIRGALPPNCLTISATEPSVITISRAGFIVLRLRRGHLVLPSRSAIDKGAIADFLNHGIRSLLDEFRRATGAVEATYDGVICASAYKRFLKRVFFHMGEKHHGGTIFLVADQLDVSDTPFAERMVLKYACNHNLGVGTVGEVLGATAPLPEPRLLDLAV